MDGSVEVEARREGSIRSVTGRVRLDGWRSSRGWGSARPRS